MSCENWSEVKNASRAPNEEEREGKMSFTLQQGQKYSHYKSTQSPAAAVCIFNSTFNTLPVFSNTFQVMGLIWTVCTSWQWSVSVLEKSSVPRKHLFCYFIWLYSMEDQVVTEVPLAYSRGCCHSHPRCSHMGCSRGRVTWCHHKGGRCPSLRAGGKASVLGPSAGVSSFNCLT